MTLEQCLRVEFDKETQHLSKADLVAKFVEDAKDLLEQRMDADWQELMARNVEMGKQVLDSTVETREVLVRSYREEVGRGPRKHLGIVGPRKAICVSRNVYRSESRMRTMLRHLGEPEYSDWMATGQEITR